MTTKRKTKKKLVPFEKIKQQYSLELSLLEQDIRRNEFQKIIADPASHVFGKTVDEVKRALDLSEVSNTAQAYKKGFADALNTLKTTIDLNITQLSKS